jgi:hypothetical protein
MIVYEIAKMGKYIFATFKTTLITNTIQSPKKKIAGIQFKYALIFQSSKLKRLKYTNLKFRVLFYMNMKHHLAHKEGNHNLYSIKY